MGNQWQRGTVQVWKTMFQNVSYLGFDLSHQNLQWVQYARGFMDLKGKTAWQGSPPGSGRRRSLALLLSVPCQGPCKLSHSGPADSLSGRGLLTRQSGRVILPTWHHFDHLRKQTNKRKTKQQKCMLAAGCLWKVPLKPLHLGQPQRTRHPEGHMWVEGLLSPESWLTVIRRHLLITYTSPSFQEHRSDVKIYKGPIKYLPKHLYNGRKGQS